MCHWLAKGGGEAFSRPLLGGTPGGWGGERPAHSRPEQILPVTSSPRGFRTQLLQHSFWPLSPRLSHQMTIKLQKLSSLTHHVLASIHTGSSLSGKARKDDLLGRGRARVGGVPLHHRESVAPAWWESVATDSSPSPGRPLCGAAAPAQACQACSSLGPHGQHRTRVVPAQSFLPPDSEPVRSILPSHWPPRTLV